MTDSNTNSDSPLILKISFKKLLEYYERLALSDDPFLVQKANRVLEVGNSVPEFRTGFSNPHLLQVHQEKIQIMLEDIFSDILTDNEIKTASMPLHNLIFNATARFKTIIADAGEDFQLKITNMPEDDYYRVACTIILYFYYGYSLNFKRPLFYEIPDRKGILQTYKILFNADFAEVIKTDFAPELTEADYHLLLNNFDDIYLWRQKFPPHSYIFKGFTINNIFNVTDDRSISGIKSNLLISGERPVTNFLEDFQSTFESLFNIKNLKVGYVNFNKKDQTIERLDRRYITSYLLTDEAILPYKMVLNEAACTSLIVEKQNYSISDIARKHEQSPQEFYKRLLDQGIKSAIFAPISGRGELLGILEIVSHHKNELNSVNANILREVMPFIVSSLMRTKEEEKHLIDAVIQHQCTSIHPSVYWRFEHAARIFIDNQRAEGKATAFEEIIFKDVYPLYGQIDVKGSSEERNQATKKDISMQLDLAKAVLQMQLDLEPLEVYEKMLHQIALFSNALKNRLKVNSEQEIRRFFAQELHPLFRLLEQRNNALAVPIANYFHRVDDEGHLIYFHRKHYDDTIALINKNMTHILDLKQVEAQQMFPHYFERYKTDGVEHSMYVGASITQSMNYQDVYLYNLELWQLQVMCEMENEFYKHQQEYPTLVDVASMILVSHKPLTIQFRTDEKQFDVFGTYNAGYEIVKKRVDKALIKGTDERVTVKGKLTIIYSQHEERDAYLNYIKFLQHKKLFGEGVEELELEDLQGITGLKAIRVPILYRDQSKDRYYTYQDMVAAKNP